MLMSAAAAAAAASGEPVVGAAAAHPPQDVVGGGAYVVQPIPVCESAALTHGGKHGEGSITRASKAKSCRVPQATVPRDGQ